MTEPDAIERAADLLERLLTDPGFRAQFRRDPVSVARRHGLPDLADELAGAGKALHTLELRESKSSLAGVVMAAAAEGVGILEFARYLQGQRPLVEEAASVVGRALTRPSLQAVSPLAAASGPESEAPAGAEEGAGEPAPALPEAEPAAPSPAAELAESPRLSLPAEAQEALREGRVDGRLVSLLSRLLARHHLSVASLEWRSVEIVAVDGEPVDQASVGARDLVEELADLAPDARPSEVAAPWPIDAPGFAGDAADRIRIAFEMPGGRQSAVFEAVPIPGTPAPATVAGLETAAPEPSEAVPAAAVAAAPGEEPAPAGSGAAATVEAELAALLENPRLILPPEARADFEAGIVDPRLVAMLQRLVERHEIELSVVKTGHAKFTDAGSISNHFFGRGLDIATVAGRPVSPANVAARELAEVLVDLDPLIRPTEIGTPWAIAAPGFFTDSGHVDHIHIAFDNPPPAGEAAAVEALPVESAGRASGVFAAVPLPEAASPHETLGLHVHGASPPEPEVAAVLDIGGSPAAPVGPVPPIAPEDMANTNAGGVLHGSEFHVVDPEGAGGIHAAYDLFARGGAPVRSPIAGVVVEVRESRGTSGQIFGGTVKIQGSDGRVWVFRHVEPGAVVQGSQVQAGQEIASVTPWADGPPHAHIELWKGLAGGYDKANMEDPLPELERAYSGGAAAVAPATDEGAGAPAEVEGAPPEAEGRASAVFAAVPLPEPRAGVSHTVQFLPAVRPEPVPEPVSGAFDVYPGDDAPPEGIARWMAQKAEEAGLPGELPVMAALVESAVRNVRLGEGHLDSVGFYQMRASIWGQLGDLNDPEIQIKWFIDRALAIREKQITQGIHDFGQDPNTWGEWIADVELPAEQYRHRYQLRLDEALALLGRSARP